MIIREDIKHMPIQDEIEHIVESLNKAIKKIKCSKLLFYNCNTIEDNAFLEIYKHNEKRIAADLLVMGYSEGVEGENISYIGDSVDIMLDIFKFILTNKEVAIVNTDTLFTEKAEQRKINYNIEIFKDYTMNYLKEILKFYNCDRKITIPPVLNEELRNILTDYIENVDLPSKYTREQLKNFSMYLPSRAVSNITLYNSITTNYITGVNKDLAKLTE